MSTYEVVEVSGFYLVFIDTILQYEVFFDVDFWTKEEVLVYFEQKVLKYNA